MEEQLIYFYKIVKIKSYRSCGICWHENLELLQKYVAMKRLNKQT